LMASFFEDWKSNRSERRSPRTEEAYRDLWDNYLLPFPTSSGKLLGDMSIGAITPKVAQEVKLGLPKIVVARTPHALQGGSIVTNRALQQASAAFSFACRMQEVPSNPFNEKVVVRHPESPAGYSFEPDELRKIGEALDYFEELARRPRSPLAHRSVAGIRLLFLTGARAAEVTDAYIERRFCPEGSLEPYALLDDPYPRILVQRAKGDRGNQRRMPGRFLWLAPRAVSVIRNVPRVPGDVFVIPGDMPGEHLQKLNKAFNLVLRTAGVRKVPLKSTRHTFRTWAPQAGVPPESVQQLLGHAGLKVTDTVYLHNIAPALLASAHRAAEFMYQRMKGMPWSPGEPWSPAPISEVDLREGAAPDVN
jgi:integrase